MPRAVFAVVACLVTFDSLEAQTPASRLFQSHEPLVLQVKTDLRTLFRDRGDERKEHDGTLRYGTAPDTGSLEITLRTRGIFRLKRCAFPPLRLDLPRKKLDATPFAGQDKLKLVTHCQSDRSYERNLLKEYSLYRVFNALTDTSHRVRLAMVTYLDSARADTIARYGFLIESDDALAKRIGTKVVEIGNLHDMLTDPKYMTLVAVFQYMIGNTDYSIYALHNVRIVQRPDKSLHPIPYDFDVSGLVNPPYGIPARGLMLKSVTDRLYRGPCRNQELVEPIAANFHAVKDAVRALPDSIPGLGRDTKIEVKSFIDSFYSSIRTPKDVRGLFVNCAKKSTM